MKTLYFLKNLIFSFLMMVLFCCKGIGIEVINGLY